MTEVNHKVGENVKIYLTCLKGKTVKYGKGRLRKKRNISFKGKIHEIRRDCVVLKGTFVYKSWCGKHKSHPKPGCKKFLFNEIMRIVKVECVTI